ncbi:pectin acetylesterase-family hydrolase [Aquabacterium sp.]|uniref:pectin acetylesterase-family hydrolase n=1 Tax=Aquabacterium sp. TaxID=1872578 RepID=UPI0035AF7E95
MTASSSHAGWRGAARTALRALALTTLMPLVASATSYYSWEAVTPAASTGASCGNGSPYRFFVNRALFTSKTVIVFEGGGACWEQKPCQGIAAAGILAATNPNGIATDYMTNIIGSTAAGGLSAGGLVTPFSARIDPLTSVQTQSWNIVYVPYCTGDVHAGNQVNVYADSDPTKPLTYYHRGYVNGKALAAWLGANLPNQSQVLVTGFSAGGVGSTAAYDAIRTAMKAKKTALLADSGPLMQAPRNGSPDVYPSVLLHNKIRQVWGLDTPTGIATELIAKYPGKGDINNLGSLTGALAAAYPNDRMSFATFQMDGVFSAFSYQKFFPEIAAAPSGPTRDALINAKWVPEVASWINALKPYGNVGYYIPYEREVVKSHCLTIITFGGTAIAEANLDSIGKVVDNLIDGSGTPIRAWETAKNPQNTPNNSLFDQLSNLIWQAMGL